MTWEELKRGVYQVDGSWRDIYVLNTNRDDWQKWAEYINKNHVVSWYAEKYNGSITQASINTSFIKHKWDSEHYIATSRIFLAEIQINCHFFIEARVENDVDPSQINSMDDHNRPMDYMKATSALLGKEVILTEENIEEAVWIKVNGDIIEFVEVT